jgi:hypothetical protein
MNSDGDFWWNWSVNAAVAVATFLAVFVALFGDWVRAMIFPPKLTILLRDPHGENALESASLGAFGPSGERNARYYHLTVENQKNWPRAKRMRPFLVKIDERGIDGIMVTKWSHELPLRWKNQEYYEIAQTTRRADVDFFKITDDGFFHFLLLMAPPTNFELQLAGEQHLVVSVQVHAEDADSGIFRFQIDWNGKWNSGTSEMANHLKVKALGAPNPF